MSQYLRNRNPDRPAFRMAYQFHNRNPYTNLRYHRIADKVYIVNVTGAPRYDTHSMKFYIAIPEAESHAGLQT